MTTGPYRICRNPIYLSFVLITLGVALLLGSLSAFAGPLGLFLVVNGTAIPYEEKRLREAFGDDYSQCRSRVRRWL